MMENEISNRVIGHALAVHRALGLVFLSLPINNVSIMN